MAFSAQTVHIMPNVGTTNMSLRQTDNTNTYKNNIQHGHYRSFFRGVFIANHLASTDN